MEDIYTCLGQNFKLHVPFFSLTLPFLNIVYFLKELIYSDPLIQLFTIIRLYVFYFVSTKSRISLSLIYLFLLTPAPHEFIFHQHYYYKRNLWARELSW